MSQTAEIARAFREYQAYVWGVVSIMFLTVVLGVELTRLIRYCTRYISSISKHKTRHSLPGGIGFRNGLIIYFTMPCTVNSSIVLTQQVTSYLLASCHHHACHRLAATTRSRC